LPGIIKYLSLGAGAPTKIVEVNPLRIVLKVVNLESHFIVMADNDQPYLAANRCQGIPIHAYESVTLLKSEGDSPDRAWWVYGNANLITEMVVIEGIGAPRERRWW